MNYWVKSSPLALCLTLLLIASNAFGQAGPGGVGDGAGTNGPRNVMWLDGTTLGALSNDDPVLIWTDQSGNGNDVAQQGSDDVPLFRNDGLGGSASVIRFDGTESYLP